MRHTKTFCSLYTRHNALYCYRAQVYINLYFYLKSYYLSFILNFHLVTLCVCFDSGRWRRVGAVSYAEACPCVCISG